MNEIGKPLRRYRVIPLKEPVPGTDEPLARDPSPAQQQGRAPSATVSVTNTDKPRAS